MSRGAPILFVRVGLTSTGRVLFKLKHANGHTFGRAFCIDQRARLRRLARQAKPSRPGAA